MPDPILKHLTGSSRRDFLRFTAVVAAALGIERARTLDVMFDRAGAAMADEAAGSRTMRTVHIFAGTGGLAWFTQLFPFPKVGASTSSQVSYVEPGNCRPANTDLPAVWGQYSPFQKLPKHKQMTCILAGRNETHTANPSSAVSLGSGIGLPSLGVALQGENLSATVPVVAVTPFVYAVNAAAPGAPPNPATIANSAGLVDLFNSTASQTVLKQPKDANLSEAYYKAFLTLNAASSRPTSRRTYGTGRVAMNLLGRNLADQLRPSAADDARYGLSATTPTTVREVARTLMTAVKAFRMGLTNSIILPAMRDDPHNAFNDVTATTAVVKTLGRILDAFYEDCAAAPDPGGSTKTLADNIVMTISGDTYKDPLNRSGWADATVQGSNVLYVFGNGYLKTGWLGGVNLDGTIDTWDPDTGKPVAGGSSAAMAGPAAGAVAYAIARGDERRVTSKVNQAIPKGVTVTQLL